MAKFLGSKHLPKSMEKGLSAYTMYELTSNHLRTELLSHSYRVCWNYKRQLRNSYHDAESLFERRQKMVEIRQKFDEASKIKDIRLAKLWIAREERALLAIADPDLVDLDEDSILPFSKNGISYDRIESFNDNTWDQYHPLEKACYPKFFAKREEIKKEYLDLWKRKMIKKTVHEPHRLDAH